MYTIIVMLLGILTAFAIYCVINALTYEPVAGLIGSIAVLLITFVLINYPSSRPEVKKAKDLLKEAESLTDEAYDTKILHGGIPVELYDKIKEHNEKVKEEIDENNFWIKAAGYDVDDCIINISDYKIITENVFTQPVRIAEDPTEPTSEPVTEASTETTETATKQVVEIDGQYYELVPIG